VKNKTVFYILLVFVFCCNIVLAQDNDVRELEKVSLQLQWKDQFQFAGYYMAKEKGFYKDAGFEVEIRKFDFKIDPVDSVNSKQATFATGRSSLISAYSKRKDIVAIAAIFQTSPLVFISKKSSGINTIKDFNGKRIAFADYDMHAGVYTMLKSQKMNFNNIKIIISKDKLKLFREGKVDIISVYDSNEAYILEKEGIKLNIFNPFDYGFDFYSDILFTHSQFAISNPKKVDDFKNASLKGWRYAFNHIDETVNFIYENYNAQNKTKDELRYEAEILKEHAYKSNKNLGDINSHKIQRISDMYSFLGFLENKIAIKELIFQYDKLKLTPKEKEYIKKKKVLNICINNDWLPYEKIIEGKIFGISGEYLEIIKNKLEVELNIIPMFGTDGGKLFYEKNNCDMKSTLVVNILNKERYYFKPSKIFLHDHIAIATKINQEFVQDINSYKDRKFLILKGYHKIIDFMEKEYPFVNFELVDSQEEALKMVENEEAFAFIGDSFSLSHYIQKYKSNTLKIMMDIGSLEFGIGVDKQDDILYSIVNKILDSVGEKQRQKIKNEWISTIDEKESYYTVLLYIVSIFILGSIFFVYRQKLLYKQNEKLISAVSKATQNLEAQNKELKKERDKTIESVKNFQYLINMTMEGIILSDENRNIIRINDAAVHMFGFKDKDEAKKGKLQDFIPEYELAKIQKNLNLQSSEVVELDMRKKDKSVFPAIVKGRYIIQNNQMIRISTIIDLSEIKEKEKLIQQQSEMALMGEMISMIAHQWRQPLNVIGAINMKIEMKLEFEESITQDYYATISNDINKQLEFMSHTIDDFRNFFKSSTGKNETNLNLLVETTMKIVQTSIENKNIKLIFDLQSDETFLSYENEIRQVILNLVNNSVDLLINRKVSEPFIQISTHYEEGKYVLEVEDNAGGVKKKNMDRIFDPYFSTKKTKHGSGLGLYMSKIIVEEHCKGKLYFKNTIGLDENPQGVIFRIELYENIIEKK